MTMLNQNIEMFQAENKTVLAPVTDSDGDPLGMTGATVRWEVYLRRGSPVLVKTTEDDDDPITLFDAEATNDGVRIPLLPADTEDLPPLNYRHECRVTDSSGNEEVVFEGALKLKYSETKT